MEPGSPQPPPQPQPAEPPPAADADLGAKAGAGVRALAIVAALVLAFAAAVAIITMADLSGLTPCGDVGGDASKLSDDGTCFDGSGAKKAISLILGWPGAILLTLSVLLVLGFAIRGRGARMAIAAVIAGAVLFGLSIGVGSL